MIGPLEIVIIAVILLVAFGGYKKLPELGRSAGRNARIGGEKARELTDQAGVKAGEVGGKVGERVGDRFDPADMGRTAGKHVREAREFRDSFKSMNPMAEAKAKASPAATVGAEPGSARETTLGAPTAEPAPEPSSTPEPGATPEPEPLAGRDAEVEDTPEPPGQPKRE